MFDAWIQGERLNDRHLSQTHRSWVFILIVANLLVTVMVSLYLVRAYRMTEEAAQIKVSNFVSSIRFNLDSLIGEIDMALRSLAEEPVTGPDSEARRLKLIATIAHESQEFRTLIIADAEGVFVGGKLAPDGKPFNITGRDYFDYLKNTPGARTVIKGPMLGRSNGKWSLVFARRLNDKNGKFAGVVLTGYAVERFAQSFAPLVQDGISTLTILRSDRTVTMIYPENPRRKPGSKIALPEFEAALSINPDQGFIPRLGTGLVDDPLRMAAYQRSENGEFYVGAAILTERIFAAIEQQTVAFLIMLLIMYIASGYFARRILQAENYLHKYQHQLEVMVDSRTQELIIAKDLAESANRVKSTFIANISHELRTPMNTIMGMTKLALNNSQEPKVNAYLDKATESANKLLVLINDLIEYSQLESGRIKLDISKFDLSLMLDDIYRQAAPTAHSKNLSLKIAVAPEVPLHLIGDAKHLGDMLRHYVSNALKFTHNGGIGIDVSVATNDAEFVTLNFSVTDSGIGVSESDQAELFRIFEQIDGSLRRRYNGTGLGLASVKQLALLMHGNAGMESQLGQGSRFWFTARFGIAIASQDPASSAGPENKTVEFLTANDAGQTAITTGPCSEQALVALRSICPLLIETLETGDISARDMLKEHAKIFLAVAPNQYLALVKEVDEFRFDQAVIILRKLMGNDSTNRAI